MTAATLQGTALTPRTPSPGARVLRAFAGCLLLAWLTGCAVTKPVVDTGSTAGFETRRQQLTALAGWNLRGRISVQMGKDAWSATLHWRQQDGNYSMRLIAPLGGGTWEIDGDSDGVSLHTADDRLLLADQPETLMQDHFGWQIPLTGLRYWVLGIPEPAPQPDSLVVDATGRLTGLEQAGWRVVYTRYADRGAYQLPRTITLQHQDLRVKLVVLEWEFPP